MNLATSKYTVEHLLLIVIGFGVGVKIRLIGELLLSEVVFLLVFLFIALFDNKYKFKAINVFVVLLIVWFANQVVTDLIVGTPFVDYIRGWSIIIVMLVNLLVVYYVVDNDVDRLLLLLMSFIIGKFLGYFLFPTEEMLTHGWKFGTSFPIALTIGLFSVYLNKGGNKGYSIAALVFFAYGVISFLLGARSISAIALLTTFGLLFVNFSPDKLIRRKFVLLLVTAAGIFVGVFMTLMFYTYLAENGYLSEEATVKYYRQSSTGRNIIDSARPETRVLLKAISDSPIIGHGSWAKNSEYRELYYIWRKDTLDEVRLKQLLRFIDRSELIPTHSHLFGSWVRSGIFGGIFWMVSIALIGYYILVLAQRKSIFLPLAMFWGLYTVNHILFSPFGLHQRIQFALVIVFLVVVVKVLDKQVLTNSSSS